MSYHRLIIDGYSLIYQDPDLAGARSANMILARQQLLRKIDGLAPVLAEKTTVVFDGQDLGPPEDSALYALEIIYSPSDKTADTVIERIVHREKNPQDILVVTSDFKERDTVSAAGAQTMSCEAFLALCKKTRAEIQRRNQALHKKMGDLHLGDFFPR